MVASNPYSKSNKVAVRVEVPFVEDSDSQPAYRMPTNPSHEFKLAEASGFRPGAIVAKPTDSIFDRKKWGIVIDLESSLMSPIVVSWGGSYIQSRHLADHLILIQEPVPLSRLNSIKDGFV